METKILSSIKKQLDRDPKKLVIENYHLVRLSEALQVALAACADNLTNLSLAGCKLNSLANLPALPRLRALNLNDNNLKDDDLLAFRNNRHLKYLYLAGNRVATVGAIEKLNGNSQLKMIDVFGCPVGKTIGCRDALFKIFPNLYLIDYTTIDDEEVSYAQSEDTESEQDEAEDVEEGDFIDDNGTNDEENRPEAISTYPNSQNNESKKKVKEGLEIAESDNEDENGDDNASEDEDDSADDDASIDKHPDDDRDEDDEADQAFDKMRPTKKVRTNDDD